MSDAPTVGPWALAVKMGAPSTSQTPKSQGTKGVSRPVVKNEVSVPANAPADEPPPARRHDL